MLKIKKASTNVEALVFLVEATQQLSNPKEQYINDLNLLKVLKIDVNRIEMDQHNHLQFPPHKTKQYYT